MIRVLRLRDGDAIEALDGQGRSAVVTLRVRGAPGPRLEYRGDGIGSERRPSVSGGSRIPPVILETAVLKGEAMEWVVEKSVELGVQALVPVLTAHTVVRIQGKGPEFFRDRWQKIADQALKQCGRLEKLRVERPQCLNELLARVPARPLAPRLGCDETTRLDGLYLMSWLNDQKDFESFEEIRILVGPEGGWSEDEREMFRALKRAESGSFHRVGLGPWVLRGETAAIFSASLVTATFRTHETSFMRLDKKGL